MKINYEISYHSRVKYKNLRKFIVENLSHFYAFSYVISPDELFAQQAVLDSITITIDEMKKSQSDYSDYSLLISIYSGIYKIGKKRFHQCRQSFFIDSEIPPFFIDSEIPPFFSEEINNRAILFLKYKLSMEESLISLILEKSITEIRESSLSSRDRIYRHYKGNDHYQSGDYCK